MSTAPPAPDSGADAGEESTALFAELDALLERMLALPVSSRDEPEAPAEGPPPPQDLPPLITIAEATPEPVLTYTTPPAPVTIVDERVPPQHDLDFASANSLAEPAAVAAGFQPADPESLLQSAGFKPAATEEAAAPADVAPATTPETTPAPESLTDSIEPPPPLWLWPLFWVNRNFDRATVPLGALGRWLRGPSGKSLLGWAGLLLLAIAGGIALHDWFGWTW
jgi:hypothetical protein